MICEGGLPLNVVAHEHERHIKLFFRALIQHAERHQVSARSFVEEQLPLLPLGFQNDTVAELSWRFADAIACGWVPGGNPLLGDVPWVFEGGEPPVAKLLGQGSVRSDSFELWLLVPASVVVSSDRGTVRRVVEGGREAKVGVHSDLTATD